MADKMATIHTPLTIIVAATTRNGIGKNGALPWPMLKKEMAYFARVTKRVPVPSTRSTTDGSTSKRNAVIMGRKTWDSIPPKFRPLRDRTNVVISRQARGQLGGITDDVVVAPDIISGLKALEDQMAKEVQLPPVGRVFVIGGSSIYEAALDLPQTTTVLITRVQREYDCDTFFPADLDRHDGGWTRKRHAQLEAFAGEDVPNGPLIETTEDGEVKYEFQLYERGLA